MFHVKHQIERTVKDMEKTEVVKVMVSEEKAHAIEESIRNSQALVELTAKQCSVDIALKVTEAVEQKVHVLRGKADNMKGASEYLAETFGIKDTQRKTYAIVTHKFATRDKDDTSYTLMAPELRDFGVGNLEEIQKFDDFDNSSIEALAEFMQRHSISKDTTVKALEAMRKPQLEEKKPEKADVSRETSEDKKPEGEDNLTTKIKAENDHLHEKVESTRTLVARIYQLALDKQLSDKEYRKQSIEILAQLEKTFK